MDSEILRELKGIQITLYFILGEVGVICGLIIGSAFR